MKRTLAIIALLVVPVFGPGMIPAVVVLVCAYTAYTGPRKDIVPMLTGVLLGIELLYGADIGVLSFAYLTSAFFLIVLERFFSLIPWSIQRGWDPLDAFRTFIVTLCLLMVSRVGGIVLGHVLYGYGEFGERLLELFHGADVLPTLIMIGIVMVVLRRINEPFRRQITFGT